MKNIRFDFICAREVPFYAHLCNQYLHDETLKITIGCDAQHPFGTLRYFIEAQGEQAQLEQLADAIAADFLLSAWLIDSGIKAIDTPQGSKALLHTPALPPPLASHPAVNSSVAGVPFCQQCYPLIGDNQAAKFGQLDLACPCCHGELLLTPAQKALTLTDLNAMAAQLLSQGRLDLAAEGISLSLSAFPQGEQYQRPQLLICDPNRLSDHFSLKERQIFALSSIEKPLISAAPMTNHRHLNAPLYDIGFAYSRVVLVLAELLRQKGVNWVYLQGEHNRTRLAWVAGAWAECTTQAVSPAPRQYRCDNEPLRDAVDFGGFHASWQQPKGARQAQGVITLVPTLRSRSHHRQQPADSLDPDSLEPSTRGQDNSTLALEPSMGYRHAECALLSAMLSANAGTMLKAQQNRKLAKNSAVIYLSQQHPSQIVTCDAKGETALFFALPPLPDNGYAIFHQLDSSPQRAVAQKFKQLFPDDYLKLLSLQLQGRRDNLQSLWAIAAILIGLNKDSTTQSPESLSDALMAAAMAYQGSNAPRIDYPLTKGEAYRSVNWCKTLGTVLSFRIAGNEDPHQLAFAMHDSLADYLANWLEHLDLNIGIQHIALAGNAWSNDTLAQRVNLRLGKNFPLVVNRHLELDGANLAVGALFAKGRDWDRQD